MTDHAGAGRSAHPMSVARTRAGVLLVALTVLTTACSSGSGNTGSGGSPGVATAGGGASASTASSTASPTGAAPSSPASTSAPNDASRRLEIVAGAVTLTATLNDTAASNDLLAQLPVTITMSDHGGVEKTGALPRSLSTQGVPAAADPAPGDLGYYAPGGDLVLYYGDQGSFSGIVVLGTLDGDLDALGQASGDLTVQVRQADGG